MQLQRIIRLLVASVSIISLGVAGCTQQREFDAEAQERTSTVQTPAPTSTVQTEQSQPSVPYVPTPNEVVEQMLNLQMCPVTMFSMTLVAVMAEFRLLPRRNLVLVLLA